MTSGPDAAPAPVRREWTRADDAEGDPSFAAVIDVVLGMVWQLLPLVSLRLAVPGLEHVAVRFARPATQPPEDLVSWSAPIPASDWVATGGVSATARARNVTTAQLVVDQAASLIGHLISADRRRQGKPDYLCQVARDEKAERGVAVVRLRARDAAGGYRSTLDIEFDTEK